MPRPAHSVGRRNIARRLVGPLSAVALLALAAAPATQPSEDIAKLIRLLGDPEPAVRKDAYDRLATLKTAAIPALSIAARGPQPAVADAAADLLLKSDFTAPGDAQSVKLFLTKYGQQQPLVRAGTLQSLARQRLPNFANVIVRILQQDPSDEVGWLALDNLPAGAEMEAALTATRPDRLTPPLKLFLARVKDRRGDNAGALELVQSVLDAEQDHPTATGGWLTWAVQLVVTAETQQNQYAAAADRLRELIARYADDPGNRSTLVDQLLDLHARHGPLKGFVDDLKLASVDSESHATYAIALAANRLGLSQTSDGLLQAAIGPRDNEAEPDRMARLSDTAEALANAGQIDAACHLYDVVAVAESPLSRGRVTKAYERLSMLHAYAGRPALAGDALQRAIDRQDASFTMVRNGRREICPIEDVQANVYFYYLLDAEARHDAAATAKQAKLMIASGSAESGTFLDALPAIEAAGTKEEVDAYFARVFERAKQDLDTNLGLPVYYNDLAWLCARSNRKLKEAASWAETAVKLSPTESAYLDTLAEVKFRTGKFEEAVDLESRALATMPEEGEFMQKQLNRFKAATTQPAK